MTARRQGTATPLTRERIVEAALAIVDEEGLDKLSMRRLGARLGVDPMAVYYHVPNKDALHDMLVEAVMSEMDLASDDPLAVFEDRIVNAGRAYRDAMYRHANALPIVLGRGPRTLAALRPVELLVGIYRDAGLGSSDAVSAMNVTAAMVRGAVSMYADDPGPERTRAAIRGLATMLPPDEFPNLIGAVETFPHDPDGEFEWALRTLASGLVTSRLAPVTGGEGTD